MHLCLKKSGYEVIIIDPEAEGISYEEIRKRLKNFKPEVVGISLATPNFGRACKIAKMAKQEVGSIVVLGGPHVSSMHEVIIQNYPDVDMVCIGEGEELCSGKNPEEIKGIAYRKNGKVVVTSPRTFVEDMDSIPFPTMELVSLE